MICNSEYYYHKNHKLNVIGNFVQFPNHDCNRITLYINKLSYTIETTSFHKTVYLPKGLHVIQISIFNCHNLPIANIPSIGNGYNSTRYLFTWLKDETKNTDIKLNNQTSFKIEKPINYTNNENYNKILLRLFIIIYLSHGSMYSRQ